MRSTWGTIRQRLGRDQTIMVALAIAYVVTGKLGLMLGYSHPAVSLIFPPAGIALGAFLVLGYRVWVAILLAALVLYSSVLGMVPAVAIMAAGTTAEGLLASYLINRFAGGRSVLQNPKNALRFAGLTLLTSTTIGPTVVTLTLVLFGLARLTDIETVWFSVALGTFASAVMVAPVVLLFTQGSKGRWKTSQAIEGAAVFVLVLLVGLVVFCGFPMELRGYPLELSCIVVLLWAAFRLGRRSASMAILVLAGLAIFGTLSGYGTFARTTPTASLAMVVSFMSLISIMTFSLASLAAEYSVAEAQLREMVVTDPLTGLPNHRRLVEVLGQEMARANKNDRPFAVVFFDMDGLKRINDELGHLIGSRAICRFAETLRASCRANDTAARYGGDEFVVVLNDTDDEGANIVIQRVMDRLAEDRDKPELSTSAGVAVYPRDGSTPTTLLAAADRALYAVKAEKATARRRGVVPIREWTNAGVR